MLANFLHTTGQNDQNLAVEARCWCSLHQVCQDRHPAHYAGRKLNLYGVKHVVTLAFGETLVLLKKHPQPRVVSGLFFHFNLPIPCTVSPDVSNVLWIRPGSHWFLLDSDGASANGFVAVDGLGSVFPLYLDCFEFDFKVELGANTNNHVDVYNSLGWKSLVELDCLSTISG